MPTYDKLVDHLPTLWRPQPHDQTLLAQWLAAVGSVFDGGAADIQHVLRAHWFDTADAAAWAKHFSADRQERGLGALRIGHAPDQREALRYPYVRDLSRLGALLDLPPWRDPASLREEVEEYRQRVGDVLAAYREGLVTPAALRRLVDAALPEDMTAPLAAQRGRYAIEEPVALKRTATPLVATPAVQETDRVAPLSRWVLQPTGTPGFVLQGTAADAIGAVTLNPMVERYTPGAAVTGIGVAYAGTLAPGQALRLLPGRRHWLLRGAALLASGAETASTTARDPSANGPFAQAATLPAGRATAVAGAPDGSLWLIQRTQVTQRVHRFNGSTLQAVETDAPAGPYHAILCAGDSAWLGTDAGLFRCHLWAEGGLRWQAVAGVGGAVRVLAAAAGDGLYAAGAQGLWQLNANGSIAAHRHETLDLVGFVAHGTRELLATGNALFSAHQGQVWRYAGGGVSEDLPDWAEANAPDNAMQSPLPAVHAIAVTPDGSLWLGGPAGLARWFAADDGVTRLAAFPDVFAGAVQQLGVDDRGMLWIAGDDGLFRFDGRDLAQYDFGGTRWLPLGDADTLYPQELRSEPRGFWRYDRATSRWQRHDARTRRFADADLPARAAPSDAIAGVLMRPALQAELGSWDGSSFTATADVPAASLRLRIKPDETRCIDGVLPYLPPALATGTWRYLQMTPTAPDAPLLRPWWSTEGQLFPPQLRSAPVPGHRRDAPSFLADAQHEGQFDHSAFAYPPSAKLWAMQAPLPGVGIRVRLFVDDPAQPIDPAIADRVWQLIARARPAGVPLQLMAEGRILKESTP
jgi:hypothetical protein